MQQYDSRAAIAALTAAQAAAVGDATVKATDALERWQYNAASTAAASDGFVMIPADNPAAGRWIRASDYAALGPIIAGIGGGGTGSVSSVALAMPATLFSVTGSPVTGAGTLTAVLKTQLLNTVWAGPAAGANDAPTFRALVTADIPDLSDLYDADGAAAAALVSAKTYTDTAAGAAQSTAQSFATDADVAVLAKAKSYADMQDTANLAIAEDYAATQAAAAETAALLAAQKLAFALAFLR